VRLLDRPVAIPAPRLPQDLAAQVEAHRSLGAALGASAGVVSPAQRRRRLRLLAVGLPALVVAAIGVAVLGGILAPAPPTLPVACVQDVAAGGCPVPAPAAQVDALYVDPTSPAARQVADWTAQGRTADAEALRALAESPVPLWLTGGTDTTEQVAEYVDRAAAAGAVPLFVAYNVPDRDCGSFSAGGAADAADYRSWVADVADGLRGADSVVVLEPDAVSHQLTGCAGERGEEDGERYDLLAGAVDAFTAAGARVYIDAGNPGFTGDPAATAGALERAGIERAAGFSLNVANFYSTGASVAYGTMISEALGGGVRFVIDTSRNGAGRLLDAADGAPTWCNPPDRRIGTAPTLDTGLPLVDGLLWIKRPGESDGSCRPGEPEAGGWFPDYALDLVDG